MGDKLPVDTCWLVDWYCDDWPFSDGPIF